MEKLRIMGAGPAGAEAAWQVTQPLFFNAISTGDPVAQQLSIGAA